MRPILLDTNAYSAFKLAKAEIVTVIKHAEIIAMSPVVLGELLGGFARGTKSIKNRQELQEFLASSRVKFYPITEDTANFYSKIYAALINKGKPIPTNDLWIAAQAMENGCGLCSYDSHFTFIEGLITGKSCAELII